MADIIYLDNATTTPLDPAVLREMLPYYKDDYGNPSVSYRLGNRSKIAIENARRIIVEVLGARNGNVFFTSGGSEGNNWAIRGMIAANNIKHVITSPIEHASVRSTFKHLAQQGWVSVHELPLDPQGNIVYDALETLLSMYPSAFVSLMHGNNEVGNLTDIERVGTLCRQHGALFHSDMVQTISHLPIDLQHLPVDVCTASAHKFHGPKGIGFIYVRDGIKMLPLIYGGVQEKGMRAGTENVAAIVGMGKALEIAHQRLIPDNNHLRSLKSTLIEKIVEAVPNVHFNGASADMTASLPAILNVGFPWKHYQKTLLLKLDVDGICAASGSACMSGTQLVSHVLKAIGVPYPESSVRFSFSRYNTLAEMAVVAQKLSIYSLK
ncbi:MAG: cysteine desulfurase family protein [Cytophagales bacterium]